MYSEFTAILLEIPVIQKYNCSKLINNNYSHNLLVFLVHFSTNQKGKVDELQQLIAWKQWKWGILPGLMHLNVGITIFNCI